MALQTPAAYITSKNGLVDKARAIHESADFDLNTVATTAETTRPKV